MRVYLVTPVHAPRPLLANTGLLGSDAHTGGSSTGAWAHDKFAVPAVVRVGRPPVFHGHTEGLTFDWRVRMGTRRHARPRRRPSRCVLRWRRPAS